MHLNSTCPTVYVNKNPERDVITSKLGTCELVKYVKDTTSHVCFPAEDELLESILNPTGCEI